MKTFTAKAVSLLLSLALLMSVFTVAAVIGVNAEEINEPLTTSDFTYGNGKNASYTMAKNSDGTLLTVTNPKSVGSDKGFYLNFTGLEEKMPTKITLVFSSTVSLTSTTVAFGEYSYVQDITNVSTVDCVKKYTTIGTTDTSVSFDFASTKQYNTFYMSRINGFTTSAVLTLKSVTITYDSAPSNKVMFNTNCNHSKEMSFADDYWKVGEWNTSTGAWGSKTDRISITKKIPVIEGAYYTFDFDTTAFKGSNSKNYQILTRIYKSAIGTVADGDDMVASENSSTFTGAFIKPENSMTLISGGGSSTNIDQTGTKIKVNTGVGAAYMLISIFGNGNWDSTKATAALTTQKNDGFKFRITETLENSTSTYYSKNGSEVTAPAKCAVNPGETFIGWRDDTTKELYPGGYVFSGISEDKSFTAVSAKIETQEGASVRWSNTDKKRGLRFETHITGNLPAEELVKVFSPAKVGTQITMDGVATPLTVSNSTDAGGANEYASVIDNTTSSTLIYYGSVTEFESSKTNISTNFTAKGVATVVYADDSTADFESSVSSTRNMFDVATAAYNALNSGSDAYRDGKMQLLQEVYLGFGDGGAED